MIDITLLLECIRKLPADLDPVSRAAVTLLNHAAHQMCEGHTGRRFSDLDEEERNFWRNEAWTSVLEWNNEHAWLEKRSQKVSENPESNFGIEHGT